MPLWMLRFTPYVVTKVWSKAFLVLVTAAKKAMRSLNRSS